MTATLIYAVAGAVTFAREVVRQGWPVTVMTIVMALICGILWPLTWLMRAIDRALGR